MEKTAITSMKTGVRHFENASCRVRTCVAIPNQMRTKCRELTALDVPDNLRKGGMATELMRNVTEEADAHEMLLLLFPEPFGAGERMSQERLINWYVKFGFQIIQVEPKVMMARMPHSTPGDFKPSYMCAGT